MARAKAKGKGKTQKKVPFGGYAVNFKGCTDTLESLFGSAPIPPSSMCVFRPIVIARSGRS